jgi:hypothetical protein
MTPKSALRHAWSHFQYAFLGVAALWLVTSLVTIVVT